jgi:hypothetical protein
MRSVIHQNATTSEALRRLAVLSNTVPTKDRFDA